MTKIVVAALGLLALTGCSAAPDIYDFAVADAQERLVNGTYPKGSIQNFSSHNITPSSVGEGRIEWQIRMDDGNVGFRCESQLTPANDAGTQVRIVSQCGQDTGDSDNMIVEAARRSLERLIESNLTGKPYVKGDV